ncbi:MAG: GldG family protein [Deltaproteobacteria bacterium]|nr:GldG family protein [Deltaproteobacteria bacterium]
MAKNDKKTSKEATARRKSGFAIQSVGTLVLIAGALVVLNLLAYFYGFGRVDLTENRVWSLSDGSKELVANLDDEMEITAYYSDNMPAPHNATSEYVRDILEDYADASKGNVQLNWVSVETDDDKEAAEEDGVQPNVVRIFENDRVSDTEVYAGLVIKYLGATEVIAPLLSVEGLEYTLTMKIKELAGDKPVVGIISGHQGPTLAQGLSSLREALPTYELREVGADEPIEPNEYAALLLVAPTTELSIDELMNIDQYVMKGGSLGVFGAALSIAVSEQGQPNISPFESGIDRLLERWGVKHRTGVVHDWLCTRVAMQGPFGIPMAVPYPPSPDIAFTDEQREHPAAFRLPNAPMPLSTPLELTTAGEDVSIKVLARSSENSWLVTGDTLDLAPKQPREWIPTNTQGPFELMVSIEGQLPSAFAGGGMSSGEGPAPSPELEESDGEVRVLVVGSSGVLRDEFLPPANQGRPRDLGALMALALNSIDWLAAESELIAIRAKNVEDPKLQVPDAVAEAEEEALAAMEAEDREAAEEALEKRKEAVAQWDRRKSTYKWMNTLGIPFLFALFGIIRWRMRTARRKNIKL